MFPILFLFLQLDTSAMVIQESIFKVSGTLFNNIIPDPTMISDKIVRLLIVVCRIRFRRRVISFVENALYY